MKTHYRWMRGILVAGAIALLLSCGGGGGGGGGGSAGSLGTLSSSSSSSTTGPDGAAGANSGSTGSTGGTGTAGGSDGSGSTGGTDGTATAGNGSGDGAGVGSGGTGVSTADATGVGSVDGLGSIILNGVRYKTYPEAADGIDPANFSLEDTTELQIGMSVRIAGKIDTEFTAATAQQVESAAELRGAISTIDVKGGSFVVMGTTVTVDNATVWSGANSLNQVIAGSVVQVWGLPSAPGSLRATRVELKPASAEPLVTGFVQNLDPLAKSFTLGQLTVRYGGAAFSGGIDESTLAGSIVRVRGSVAPDTGVFNATKVQGWYAVPKQDAVALQLAGVITNYAGPNAFTVLGMPIDASNAQVTGGPANNPWNSIGNGVKVEVDGFVTSGVLVVKKLRIRNIPGTGGPVVFTVIGPIAHYQSASEFMVKGQRVNAGGSGTVFENGTVADLANLPPGRQIAVVGNAVVDGVLIAQTVSFLPP